MTKITKDTTLAEIMESSKAQEILLKYKVPCLGCSFAQYEMKELKIGDICKMYNINLSGLLKELNNIYTKKV